MPSPSFAQSNDIPRRVAVFTKAVEYAAAPADLTRNGACPAIIIAAPNGTLVLVDMDDATVTFPQELLDRPIVGGAFKSVSNASTSTALSVGYNTTGG